MTTNLRPPVFILVNSLLPGGVLDRVRAATHFLQRFRMGKLGHITLDACVELSSEVQSDPPPVQFLHTQ